jgi:hypothetical protein
MTPNLWWPRLLSVGLVIICGCANHLGGGAQYREPTTRQTTREFLVRGEVERVDYGLNSYLLFGAPPSDDARRTLYLQTLLAYFDLSRADDALAVRADPWELNLTYVPVTEPPPPAIASYAAGMPSEVVRESAALWTLDHYDYARAGSLLRDFGPYTHGPYLVSSLTPLTGGPSSPSDHRVFQDLSTVPPELAAAWMDLFNIQVSKPRYWEQELVQSWMLSLRGALRDTAQAWPEVQKAVAELIKLSPN